MPRFKTLTFSQLEKILRSFSFQTVSQRGSHIKMVRNHFGVGQVLIFPRHRELRKGTLKGIFNQAKRYVSETELRKPFYTY